MTSVASIYSRSQAADLAGRQSFFVLSQLAGREKCGLAASRPNKNNRLSRREKCSLITEESIITVFNIYSYSPRHIRRPLLAQLCFLCVMCKTHILSLH